jgi:hypothetical protein
MKSQCKRAALFVLFLMPAAAATLPAFGESVQDGPTTAPAGYHRASAHPRASNPQHPGRARTHARLAPNRNVLDDACDLPGTGCESYLAN